MIKDRTARKWPGVWTWLFIVFSIITLVVMLVITIDFMPSRKKADLALFLGAVSVVQQTDPKAKNIYFSDLVDKYMPRNKQRITYLDATNVIARDYSSPEFKQELDRLMKEREGYLKDLRMNQIYEIASAIVVWAVFVALLYVALIHVVRSVKWVLHKSTKKSL